ncbi:hypothetical protein COL30_01725 [Bacillus pseudomycoides]|nr:hypothetical protein COO19_16535 [Bacillus pseudomycoides]PEK11483.1 hypothetical protein CN693_26225 [Bacillus pseudomycoides]PEO21574.1 hypothetical protein CN542_10385 [Bacillus pseudomycoides]PEP68279.1 hypothetical protein CN591_09090 [Bacillus pseudomycoides]PFW69209.1 hypothetical protein COL25_08965 [Bacillus pseudomycoides]
MESSMAVSYIQILLFKEETYVMEVIRGGRCFNNNFQKKIYVLFVKRSFGYEELNETCII